MSRIPAPERWARIGSRDPSWLRHVPKGGLCLSAFVVIRKSGSILLGRPHADDAWPEKGGFPRRHAAELEKDGSWLLPATHLMTEESPDHAARRIASRWVGVRGVPKFVMVQSHLRPRRSRKLRLGSNHWDICFIYELRAATNPKPRPWWSEMGFFSSSEIHGMKLGRGHKDILRSADYL